MIDVPGDALALELEVDRIEARAAVEVAAALRARWADPAARGLADPPVLRAPAALAVLGRARRLGGDVGARAAALWRLALAAAAAIGDDARQVPQEARTAERLAAAAATRNRRAVALGFVDAWALARAVAGEDDAALAAAPAAIEVPGCPDDPAFARVLAAPAALLARLAERAQVDARAIQVAIVDGDAADAGRTFIVEPGRDVRVRVHRRPGASARGTVRVLLHELGHALPAAQRSAHGWARAQPASRAADEAAAARAAALLEQPAFLVDVLGVAAASARAIAAAEHALRRRRRARLAACAEAERAMYRGGGAPPWPDDAAWRDPGGAHSYALAEQLLDDERSPPEAARAAPAPGDP